MKIYFKSIARPLIISVIAAAAWSCIGSNKAAGTQKMMEELKADTTAYFAGKFMYMADAAVFKDCATGVTFSVPMESKYIDAERKYMSLDPKPGEYIFTEVTGKIIKNDLGKEEGLPYSLRITSLIGMERREACSPAQPVPGIYECREGKYAATLHLRPNYEAKMTRYDNDGNKTKETNMRWQRSVSGKYMFVYREGRTTSWWSFEYDGEEEINIHDQKEERTFKKVYL